MIYIVCFFDGNGVSTESRLRFHLREDSEVFVLKCELDIEPHPEGYRGTINRDVQFFKYRLRSSVNSKNCDPHDGTPLHV